MSAIAKTAQMTLPTGARITPLDQNPGIFPGSAGSPGGAVKVEIRFPDYFHPDFPLDRVSICEGKAEAMLSVVKIAVLAAVQGAAELLPLPVQPM